MSYIYIPGRAGFLSSATSATVKVEVVMAPSRRQAGWTVFRIIRLLKLRIAVPGQDMGKTVSIWSRRELISALLQYLMLRIIWKQCAKDQCANNIKEYHILYTYTMYNTRSHQVVIALRKQHVISIMSDSVDTAWHSCSWTSRRRINGWSFCLAIGVKNLLPCHGFFQLIICRHNHKLMMLLKCLILSYMTWERFEPFWTLQSLSKSVNIMQHPSLDFFWSITKPSLGWSHLLDQLSYRLQCPMSNSIHMSKDHTNIITSASISGAPSQQAIVWLPISIWLPCLTQEPGCHGPRRSLKSILRYW